MHGAGRESDSESEWSLLLERATATPWGLFDSNSHPPFLFCALHRPQDVQLQLGFAEPLRVAQSLMEHRRQMRLGQPMLLKVWCMLFGGDGLGRS